MAMMLSLAYRLADADRYTREDSTFQEQTMALMGQRLLWQDGRLIGLGRVGMHMVPRCKAFNMRCCTPSAPASRRTRSSTPASSTWTLLACWPRATTSACWSSYSDQTHEMMGAKQFAQMKKSAYFITRRAAGSWDEKALIVALQDGTIAGPGLEVFYSRAAAGWHPFVPEELRAMKT